MQLWPLLRGGAVGKTHGRGLMARKFQRGSVDVAGLQAYIAEADSRLCLLQLVVVAEEVEGGASFPRLGQYGG